MSAAVAELFDPERVRIVTAIGQRARYRYVQPVVLAGHPGWRIVSPCCSRNVDADGGLIDIAWLEPRGEVLWRLYARDHVQGRWLAVAETSLDAALEMVCEDRHRIFWP